MCAANARVRAGLRRATRPARWSAYALLEPDPGGVAIRESVGTRLVGHIWRCGAGRRWSRRSECPLAPWKGGSFASTASGWRLECRRGSEGAVAPAAVGFVARSGGVVAAARAGLRRADAGGSRVPQSSVGASARAEGGLRREGRRWTGVAVAGRPCGETLATCFVTMRQ